MNQQEDATVEDKVEDEEEEEDYMYYSNINNRKQWEISLARSNMHFFSIF